MMNRDLRELHRAESYSVDRAALLERFYDERLASRLGLEEGFDVDWLKYAEVSPTLPRQIRWLIQSFDGCQTLSDFLTTTPIDTLFLMRIIDKLLNQGIIKVAQHNFDDEVSFKDWAEESLVEKDGQNEGETEALELSQSALFYAYQGQRYRVGESGALPRASVQSLESSPVALEKEECRPPLEPFRREERFSSELKLYSAFEEDSSAEVLEDWYDNDDWDEGDYRRVLEARLNAVVECSMPLKGDSYQSEESGQGVESSPVKNAKLEFALFEPPAASRPKVLAEELDGPAQLSAQGQAGFFKEEKATRPRKNANGGFEQKQTMAMRNILAVMLTVFAMLSVSTLIYLMFVKNQYTHPQQSTEEQGLHGETELELRELSSRNKRQN